MKYRDLSSIYERAHDSMRNIDGLQPQEAFDELLKYLFFIQTNEEKGPHIERRFRLVSNGGFIPGDMLIAKNIRDLFEKYLQETNSWSNDLWKDRHFHLSDNALLALHDLFAHVRFNSLGFDIRSSALKTFLTPELRRGLGIFLTPDEVARMMVNVAKPTPKMKVLDPACGSGTFLIEVLKYWGKHSLSSTFEIFGTEINPRMLLLADLNLGHQKNVRFHRRLRDALQPAEPGGWPEANSFDLILTNPPFGVSIDSTHYTLGRYETCMNADGSFRDRQQSEVVFVEQCLRVLKPGGTLGIVLPKSVISNATLAPARDAIDRLGYIDTAISLPPETFAIAGTQTTTTILFIKKHEDKHIDGKTTRVKFAEVRNVGYDSTGRQRDGNELPTVSMRLESPKLFETGLQVRVFENVDARSTLGGLGAILSRQSMSKHGQKLGKLCEFVCTGRTPPRSNYVDKGLFILKVGNLTGHGVNWIPRERNFIDGKEENNRRRSDRLMLQEGDILLTSSAHNPRYIAAKIDIIDVLPEVVGGASTYVGELMLIRPRDGVDSYKVLSYLRRPSVVAVLQGMVRGQTAHLMSEDVADLIVPDDVLAENKENRRLCALLKEEAELATRRNIVTYQLNHLLGVAVDIE